MDHLKVFYDQELVRESVKQYLNDTLDRAVLDRAYKEGDVVGYKEAREIIRSAFSKLNETYAKESSSSKDNKAR